MLHLGLYFPRFLGAYNVYTEFFLGIFPKLPFVLFGLVHIELCLLLTSLSGGIIFLHYDSFQVYTIIGDTSPILNPV